RARNDGAGMERWYRVFGGSDAGPTPAALEEHLRGFGLKVTGHFHSDEQGWYRALLVFEDGATLPLARDLATEGGIRDELNTWAAWVESVADGPEAVRLMQRLIASRQVVTLRRAPGEAGPVPAEEVFISLCRFLASATEGVYQADGQGFFAPDDTLLVREAD